jgi:O-antigen/teichoic acid export membrane protein
MGVRIAGIVLSYASNVYLSRLLGVEAYGVYVIAVSWALILALPAKGGFDISALRYSSIYLESGRLAQLRGFIRVSVAVIIVAACAIGLLLVAFGARLIHVGRSGLAWTAVLILAFALLPLFSVIMRTARRIVAAQAYEQILRPALIVASAAAATLAGVRLSASSALFITALAAGIAATAIFLHLKHVLRDSTAHPACYSEWPQWLTVSASLLAGGAIQELTNQLDILLLGQLATTRDAALFSASWRIASLLPFALVALATLAAPSVAAAHERGARDELHRISRLVARLGFAFAVGAAFALLLSGRWLLGLFGPDFPAAFPVLAILLVGGIVNAFTGIVTYFMTMTGHERSAVLIFAGGLAVSLILNLLLIPRWGAVGAAVASSAGTATWNVAMLAYVRLRVGIDASALAIPPATARGSR